VRRRPAHDAKQYFHDDWLGLRGVDDAQDGQVQGDKPHLWHLSIRRRGAYIQDAGGFWAVAVLVEHRAVVFMPFISCGN
jgi:hypothetical protein